YEYTGAGLTPVRMMPQVREDIGTIDFLGNRLVSAHPVLKSWGVGSPAKVPLDQMITERGKYVPKRRMGLTAAYPVVEGYKGIPSVGYYFHFEDPMQFNQLNVTLGVSPTGDLRLRDRLHAQVEFKTLDWRYRWLHNAADFYDLLGPVERSRRGDAFIIDYNKAKIYDPPRQLDLFGSAAAYFGLERLPTAQNIVSPSRIFAFEAGVRYTNTRKSLGGVDHEKGIAWRAVSGLDYAQGDVFPKLWAGLDYGWPLPMPNSSLWLYGSAGSAWGPAQSPLGSYYFGAFRNNYIDNRPEKRYRELESFPGFDIDEISARRFAKLTGEVNLPPIRFAEVGIPSIYMSHIRPAVFAGAMRTRDALGDNHRYYNVGGQLDLNFTVALRLPMILSVGVARGFADGEPSRTEWLASLKIM
ncbi:MAG: hypothetical protein M3428_02490, partial [Pseudomonadota bacterium]|nr:hypothetical protein [Pseudomonadota bacterium]